MDEADQQPARDQFGLAGGHGAEQGMIGTLRVGEIRIVPGDDVIGEPSHRLGIAARGKILEGADADMAGSDPGQHRAGQRRLAHHALAGDDGGERARGRNAQGMHRFADDVFAQHRPQRGAAVAAARERRRAGALELDVAADAVLVDHLAEQDGAAVAQLRHELPELVAGIGHRDRVGAGGSVLPARISAPSGLSSRSGSRPSWTASGRFSLISRGEATGVGATRAKKFAGKAA